MIVRQQLPVKAGILCFDFNCLIYRCLYSPKLRPFPGQADPYEVEKWEAELLAEVVATVKEVWAAAGSPKNVYLAVDGVVPMAKIRQQRVRRFKSAWLESQKVTQGWDKNAITPGTAFMDKLTVALQGLTKKWVLSSVQEPGEGEHKLLNYLRKNRSLCGEPIVIYGLDADLILLSMLLSEEVSQAVWLLRERQEFERSDASAETEYSFLDVQSLKEKVHVTDWISCINYVALMSLMGNDFIPHSLTHKLADDGHSHILRELLAMKGSDAWLVDSGGSLNLSVLKAIAARFATEETERMYRTIEKKQKQAQRGVLQGMDPSEGLPLQWNVEQSMLQNRRLKDNWRDVYWEYMHPTADRAAVSNEYVKGVQWVIQYYLGRAVDTDWIFPYWIPPLWSDIARVSCLPVASSVSSVPPSPSEQLAMVLPLQSWGLVRDPSLRKLPLLCPQAWPISFSFFSVGRRWLWECEALVPVLTAGRIRELLSSDR